MWLRRRGENSGWSGGRERWGFRPNGPLGFVAAFFSLDRLGSCYATHVGSDHSLKKSHFSRVEFFYLTKKE